MATLSREQRARRERVELELTGDRSGSRRHRELAAFARYCIARLEREIGETGHWFVRVGPCVGGFRTTIYVANGDYTAEVAATGFDGALAIWDAMCHLEQRLREACARRVGREFDVG